MSRTPTEPSHDPIFREINLSAEVKKIWGVKWGSPELSYEFGERKFYLKTEDAGIYDGSRSALAGCSLSGMGALPDLAIPDCSMPEVIHV